MADKSAVCTICDERHIYRQSTDWCFECEQALCAECKEFHAVSRLLRNHATIPITDYQTLAPFISSIGGYCRDHDDKYQIFCQTHDKLLCLHCIEEHSECKDLIPVSKITKNVKTSEAFREAEQCLIDIDDNILNIEDKIKENITNLNDQRKIILSEIQNIRQKMNEHLDQIEAVIRKDVSDIEHLARKDLETALSDITEKKENNSSSKRQLEIIKHHASDLQTLFALRQISSELTTRETFLKSIIDSGRLDKIALEFSVNENLRNIPDKIKTFGSIRATKIPSDLTLVKQKEKQAQLVGVHLSSIQDIKLKLIQTIDTTSEVIRGCDMLSDGRIVFSNYMHRKSFVVTDADGKYLFDVQLNPRDAFDVTVISDNTVAVTTGITKPYGISIVDINTRKILKFITKENRCDGITSVDGSLVYCYSGKGIEMIDANIENTSATVKCDLPVYSYIDSHEDKLYYTNINTSIVTCCDMKGNTIWTFKDDTVLKTPRGIAVDDDGQVYVIRGEYTSLVVLSADGRQCRQLLSKEDGLRDPFALHYDRRRKRLMVANDKNTCFMFEISTLPNS